MDKFAANINLGTGDGLSQANAMEFQACLNGVNAGDNVYVKGGIFGGQTSNVEYEHPSGRNGTELNPITIIGCDSNWNEPVIPLLKSTYAPDRNTPELGTPLPQDGLDMPYIQGFRYAEWDKATNSVSGVGTEASYSSAGVGLKIRGQWVIVKNFIIEGYSTGLMLEFPNNTGYNINCQKQGDFNVNNSYDKCYVDNGGTNGVTPTVCLSPPWREGLDAFSNYDGIGIILQSENCQIYNSYSRDCGAEGIRIRGNNCISKDNMVWSDNPINATDYYHQVSGTEANPITSCYVENVTIYRGPTNRHAGHGLATKFYVSGYLAVNCRVYNTNYEFQFPDVSNNEIRDCIGTNAQINVANGSNKLTINNHISTCDIESVHFTSQNWFEANDLTNGDRGGFNITVNNSRFIGGRLFISNDSFSTSYNTGSDNWIFNKCVVDGATSLFSQNRELKGFAFRDGVIKNVANYTDTPVSSIRVFSINAEFINTTWEANSFAIPSKDNIASLTTVSNLNNNQSKVRVSTRSSRKRPI